MNAVTRFMAIGLASILLLIAGALMDGPDEVQSAQDIAEYSAALADDGVAMCKEFGRVPIWTKTGDLVCRSPEPVMAQGSSL